MAKDYGAIERQRASYLAKEQYLQSCYTQVSPMDFYTNLFPSECLQGSDDSGDGKSCAIFRFVPDKSTYQIMRNRIRDEYRNEVFSDTDELMKRFARMFDALPADDVDELEKRYDVLDKKFHAGKYRVPGQPIKLTYRDKKTGEYKDAKFDQRVHSDFKELSEAIGKATAYMAPITYYGKKANKKNARWLHAITIDLDGVGISQLKTLIAYIQNDMIPTPTYLVNSGHGMHLYYFLEEPVALYSNVQTAITTLKNNLASLIWVKRTSTINDHRDFQGCTQLYRVVGSMSKLGTGYPATAYLTGKPVSIEYLNSYLLKEEQVDLLEGFKSGGKSGHNAEYWKEVNPDWYRRVIEKNFIDEDRRLAYVNEDEYDVDGNKLGKDKKTKRGKAPAIYEKLKPKLLRGAIVGNRYFCMCVLFADACQCGIPYKEVQAYAYSLIDILNTGIENEEDLFTKADVDKAAAHYNSRDTNFMKTETVEKMTGITFPHTKRNYNSQVVHCAMMRANKGVKVEAGLVRDTRFGAPEGNDPTLGGRPSAEQTVRTYLQEHPDAKKVEVIRATGLTKPTVYKWYDKIKSEVN